MIALELLGIRKSFGSVRAIRGADLSLGWGEVHALVGENGAGKSTLMHIAFGMVPPDAGSIAVDGRGVRLQSPRDARALGIGMVHQHFTSIPGLTVAENVALAVGRRGRGATAPIATSVSERLMSGLDSHRPVSELSVGERQRLEIAKALATGARILLLDEPTGVLAPAEVEELLSLMRSFAQAGGAVALITHKLQEVMHAADRVTVLRRGVVTLRAPIAEVTERSLAEAMIGSEGIASGLEQAGAAEPETNDPAPVMVRIGDIALRRGELVGVAAVEGNGHREMLRSLAGFGSWPGAGVHGSVALVPEDRTTEGLIPDFDVTENLVLGLGADPRWARGARLDWRSARGRAATLIGEFRILAPGPDTPVRTLSGGNQQKLVLARTLEAKPDILVLENPTRGLDVRTTAEIHTRLRQAAAAGVTILVYSSDLDEVLVLAERVLVVFRGGVSEARDRSRPAVGSLMLGVAPPSSER